MRHPTKSINLSHRRKDLVGAKPLELDLFSCILMAITSDIVCNFGTKSKIEIPAALSFLFSFFYLSFFTFLNLLHYAAVEQQ